MIRCFLRVLAAAAGVLEKAESLLGPYPEWRERAAQLLASVR